MKKIYLFILLFLCVSCSIYYLAKQGVDYSTISSSCLHIPPILLKIQDGSRQYSRVALDTLSYIVWGSPDICSACEILHFKEKYSGLWHLSKDMASFQVLFIMTPKPEEVDDIIQMIDHLHFEWPIYVDDTAEMVKIMPENSKYHQFLVSPDGNILFINSPFQMGVVKKSFVKTIEDYNNTALHR